MKKISIILLIILASTVIASCIPDKPQDVLPYCKDTYESLLIDYPDYPPAFIGACVSFFQTEKATAFVSLCGYEPFIEELQLEEPSIITKKDCIQYVQHFNE